MRVRCDAESLEEALESLESLPLAPLADEVDEEDEARIGEIAKVKCLRYLVRTFAATMRRTPLKPENSETLTIPERVC